MKNGKFLVTGIVENSVEIWDVESKAKIKTFRGEIQPILSLRFGNHGKTLSTQSYDKDFSLTLDKNKNKFVAQGKKEIKVWDLSDSTEVTTIEGEIIDNDSLFAFSPDKRLMASSNLAEEIVTVTDTATNKKLFDVQSSWGLAFSSDSKVIAVGQEISGYVFFYDTSNGKYFDNIQINDITGILSFSPDGKILANAHNNLITTYDVKNKTKLSNLAGHADNIITLAFSVNGKILVSGSGDGKVKLWDVSSGKELASLISFNNEDWLVTTSEGFFDGTPNAWKQLLWRFNNDTFDYGAVELYFNDFFYPNLLQDVLNGKSPQPKAGQELGKIDRRQPTVEIASINGQTKTQLDAQTAN